LPIRWRLTLFIALAIGLILLALGLAIYLLSRNALVDHVEKNAQSGAEIVARTLEEGEHLSTASEEDDQIFYDEVSVIIRDKNGEVLQKINLPVGGSTAFDVWRTALKTGEHAKDKSVLAADNDYYVYAVAIDPSSRAAAARGWSSLANPTTISRRPSRFSAPCW
jgi:hypothetical protein